MPENKTFYSLNIYENDEEDLIATCTADSYVRIDYIVVAKEDRGHGKGRELMTAAIADAKSYNLPVYIIAEDIEGDTDISRLVRFYEDFGFSVDSPCGDGVLMSL